MENNELLPCPFCGGLADECGTNQWHFVRCSECDAESYGSEEEEEAANQWNRRYSAPEAE